MSGQGARVWIFPDGYLPSAGPGGGLVGHESLCLVNTGDQDARLTLDLYFETQEPALGMTFGVRAYRSLHLRMDRLYLIGGPVLPRETPYSARVTSSVPVVAQLSRLDVTLPNAALMTSLGYPVPQDAS